MATLGHITYLAPGAIAISEFARQVLDNRFANVPGLVPGTYHTATCVEAATIMAAHALRPDIYDFSPSEWGDEFQVMIDAWRANNPGMDPNGASSYVDATTWLRGQGFTVDENIINSGDWYQEMLLGIPKGYTYIVGVTNAQGLPGDEAGVHNHGFCACGTDDLLNIVCGDPDNWVTQANMPGNPVGGFKAYNRQDFINGQISSLTRVHPMAGVPVGWSDDGTTLKSPNGIPVVKGFRDYVLTQVWNPADWPLGPEAGRDPVTDSYPQNGGGTRQLFRYTDLIWTPTLGVTRAWTGAELAFDEGIIAKGGTPPPPAPPPYPDVRPQLAALTARFDAFQAAIQTALTTSGPKA